MGIFCLEWKQQIIYTLTSCELFTKSTVNKEFYDPEPMC